MNVKRFIHIMFVLSLILVTGFSATPTSAKAPTIFEMPVDWSGPIDNPCKLKIYATTLGIQRSTFWFDENGNLSMGHNFFNITEVWSANGNTLEFSYNYPVHGWIETYPNGYSVFLGATIATLLKEGVVLKSAGLYSYTISIEKNGEITLLDRVKKVGVEATDWPAICEYLAP